MYRGVAEFVDTFFFLALPSLIVTRLFCVPVLKIKRITGGKNFLMLSKKNSFIIHGFCLTFISKIFKTFIVNFLSSLIEKNSFSSLRFCTSCVSVLI